MVKRSTFDGQTIVYRYGCPAWAKLPESAMEQLRLAHGLRNEFVAVEYRYREIVAGIWSLHPEVAEASAAVEKATAEEQRLVDEMKRRRVNNRSTQPNKTDKQALAEVRKARREAKAALKAVKDRAKAEQDPMLREAARCRREALTAVRAEARNRGLYWGTRNDVAQNHDVAADRIAEMWKQGRAGQRRRKHWDGTGTLHVQLQREQHRKDCAHKKDGLCSGCSAKPLRTPEVLASPASPWRNVFRLEADPDKPRHGTAWVRLENADRGPLTEIPVVLHRPLPDGCEVTDVEVTRFRIGSSYRLSVAVTVRLPHPEPTVSGVPVSVVLGWASEGDGAVRVARVASPFGSLPVVEPAELVAAGVTVPAQQWTDVVAPGVWRTLLGRDAAIRSHRDELLDDLRPRVMEALTPELVEALDVRGDVSRWRSHQRFAWLARAWPDDHPLKPDLEAWRRRDRHLEDFECHERRQVTDRRRDAWRKVAAWVCSQASEVLLDAPPVAEVKRVADVSAEDTYEARAGRRQAQFAAPGELRSAIVQAAARRGVKVIDVRSGEDG